MKGGVAAGFSISISCASTSISPLFRSGFTVPSGRRRTRPVTRSTNSLRTRVGGGEGLLAIGIADHLHQALAVAQVDEDHAAMVAAAVGPAVEGHGLAEETGVGAAAVFGAH